MPVLKQTAGHTGCSQIQRYLEKNGRALARDFFNLSWDEREDAGDEADKESVFWADEMDDTRSRFGNDTPFGGHAARTYKHFVISPDPEDGIDLPALRELAQAWALRYFADYQVAIVYHDDNEGRIPHAHVVVNNTNLETGNRLHHDDPKALNRGLQDMARERGLSALSNETAPSEGLARLAAKSRGQRMRPRSMQRVYYGRAEREIAACGAYSWVADVRNRVSVARTLARNEDEFRQILGTLGVEVAENSPQARRDDWIYSLADEPSKKVSGGRLGLLFAKETVLTDFKRKETYRPTPKSSREVMKLARSAVLVNDLQDLDQVAAALETCAFHGTSSIEDCDRRISSLAMRTANAEGARREELVAAVGELKQARDFMAERRLLPARVERKTVGAKRAGTSGKSRAHASSESGRRAHIQRQRVGRDARHKEERDA